MMKSALSTILVRGLATAFVCLIVSPYASAQAGGNIKSLIRDASKECRAAKSLRRSDLEQAQQRFAEYVKILNKAIRIQPNLLDKPGPDAQRVLDFCNVVKNDLDRAEALPLLEHGLRECGEARVLISNAAFDEAREKYRQYKEYRGGALAISESVLVVYRNSYELRLCDRLEDDIAVAEEEYQEQLQKVATEVQNLFASTIEDLNQAERQCQGARKLISDQESYNSQTAEQVQNLVADAAKIVKAALSNRDKLIAKGKEPGAETNGTIDSLAAKVKECQRAVPAGITRIKTVLAANASNGTKARRGGSKKSSKSGGENQDFRQIVGAQAVYPRRAIKRGIEGTINVQFTITRRGNVTNVQIVDADPSGWFEKSVIAAVKKYKFQPRVVNGEPVDVKNIVKKITFKLR